MARSSFWGRLHFPAVSTLAIILIVVAVLLVLLFIGGLAGAGRRTRTQAPDYARHVAEADQALETARAADRGWDRVLLDGVVRDAVARERPGFTIADLHLVLVDDRPGVEQDRAHFVAQGDDGELRVVLSRSEEAGWAAERVD